MKYSITGAVGNNTIVGTAASKAPQDVCTVLKGQGYVNLYLTVQQKDGGLKRLIGKFVQLYNFRKLVNREDIELFVQYPVYKLFIPMLFFYKCKKKRLLIHDIDSVRVKGGLSWLERKNIASFDEVIVHTAEMKDFLRPYVKGKIYVLGCFDYLLSDYIDYTGGREKTMNICFAGNISKSVYLKDLLRENVALHFFLYGSMGKNDGLVGNFDYKGKFHPDKVGFLEGSWGLVWDGISMKTCSGTWGEYLRIIASHKVSLYIVAGLPLIVWRQSAMARFVEKYRIGITVDSLEEVELKIKNTTEDDYKVYLTNISSLAKILIQGGMLESVLNEIKSE